MAASSFVKVQCTQKGIPEFQKLSDFENEGKYKTPFFLQQIIFICKRIKKGLYQWLLTQPGFEAEAWSSLVEKR